MGCGHQRLDGPRVDLLDRPPSAYLGEVDGLALNGGDHAQRNPKPPGELLCSVRVRIGGDASVESGDDRARKRLGVVRRPHDEHGAGHAVEQLSGNAPDQDLRTAVVPMRTDRDQSQRLARSRGAVLRSPFRSRSEGARARRSTGRHARAPPRPPRGAGR